jgi:hypothetical protein
MFEAFELRMILNALDGRPTPVEGEAEPVMRPADPVLKAMELLGVNCGFPDDDPDGRQDRRLRPSQGSEKNRHRPEQRR